MPTNHDQTKTTQYRSDLYIITARTNMHVGSGDEAYGLVDNRVQRDVVTNLPNINASGLKGALREYFSYKWGEKAEKLIDIFGTDSFSKPDKHQAGTFRFFNANLLSIPVRSNVKPFFRATSPHVVADLIDMMDTFGYPDECGVKEHLQQLAALKPAKGNPFIFDKGIEKAVLEDYEYTAAAHELAGETVTVIKNIFGDNPVLMNDSDFMDMCDDYHLPLIARNHLKDGRSTNLWHEQVVPRESRFYFFILKPREIGYDMEFSQGEPVQIGGNASIGYGFTRIEKIDDLISMPKNPAEVAEMEKKP